MLIAMAELERIVAGEIALVFRRWRRPTVKAGGTLRTALGVLAIDAVEAVTEDQLGPADAAAAGRRDLPTLRAELRRDGEGSLFRIRVRWLGADPRLALRDEAGLADAEWTQLARRLQGFDTRASGGPWTRKTLEAIAERPACRAADLAATLGLERDDFKLRVRKLKELGLTESLEVGYRLSPRGAAVLTRLRAGR